MVSLSNVPLEAGPADPLADTALACYQAALKNLAFYVVEVDPSITVPHRRHLTTLCEEVASGERAALVESRATLRGLLREYRDKASQFLNRLREELETTARSMVEL